MTASLKKRKSDFKNLTIAFLIGCFLVSSFGWTVSHDWSQVKNVELNENQVSESLHIRYNMPSGSVISFASLDCPQGWIKADGRNLSKSEFSKLNKSINMSFGGNDTHFTLPDLRGVFVRGAGTNEILKKADGTDFVSNFADYQEDMLQGHWHDFWVGSTNSNYNHLSSYDQLAKAYPAGQTEQTGREINDPASDGIHGGPRTGAETRPVNVGLTYCIKT